MVRKRDVAHGHHPIVVVVLNLNTTAVNESVGIVAQLLGWGQVFVCSAAGGLALRGY